MLWLLLLLLVVTGDGMARWQMAGLPGQTRTARRRPDQWSWRPIKQVQPSIG